MSYSKVSSSTFHCYIFFEREFDFILRLQEKEIVVNDINILVDVPEHHLNDILISVVRLLDVDLELEKYDKQDSISYFSVYDIQDYVHLSYLSKDLTILESPSVRLNKPLSKFLELSSSEGKKIDVISDSRYCATDFSAIQRLQSLEVGVPGFSCTIFDLIGTSYPTDHDDLMRKFDTSTVHCYGNIPEVSMHGYVWNAFSCILSTYLFIPNQNKYYFGVKSVSAIEIQIDNILVASKYNSTADPSTIVWGSVQLSEGYHVVFIRYLKYGFSDIDLEVYFKLADAQTSYLLGTDNCESFGMQLYSKNYLSKTNIEVEDTFVEFPLELLSLNPSLLYLNQYFPLNILCRPNSLIIVGLINDVYENSPPDEVVVFPEIYSGTIEAMLSKFTFADGTNDLAVTMDENFCENTYIELLYNSKKPINTITIVESRSFFTSIYNASQAKRLLFSMNGENNERLNYTTMLNLMDLENCVNVSGLHWHSTYQIRIKKIEQTDGIKLKFKTIIFPKSIKFHPADCSEQTIWGLISSIKTYNSDPDITFFNANKGFIDKEAFLGTNLEESLIKYEDVTSIPMVFKPKKMPDDIVGGSDFIQFMLLADDELNAIEIFGNSFFFANTNDTKTDFSLIGCTKYLSIDSRGSLNFYTDTTNEITYDWSRLCYNIQQNKVTTSEFTSFIISIDNTGGAELTDYLIDAFVYNIQSAFIGEYNSNVVPVCGVTTADILVMDSANWDTDRVRMKITIPADSVITVTLTSSESFSNPALDLVGGTSGAIPEPAVKTDIVGLPFIATYIGIVEPNEIVELFLLKSDISNSNESLDYNMPENITIANILVSETTGEDVEVEIQVDTSSIISEFGRIPITIVDSSSRATLETVGQMESGDLTTNFFKWDSNYIRFIGTLRGGDSKIFFIRTGNFTDDASNFGILDLIPNEDVILATDSTDIIKPRNKVTSLLDLKAVDGITKITHAYSGINEVIAEDVSW